MILNARRFFKILAGMPADFSKDDLECPPIFQKMIWNARRFFKG